MKTKDKVVFATDQIAMALQALIRINYANDSQATHNMHSAATLLNAAAEELVMAAAAIQEGVQSRAFTPVSTHRHRLAKRNCASACRRSSPPSRIQTSR